MQGQGGQDGIVGLRFKGKSLIWWREDGACVGGKKGIESVSGVAVEECRGRFGRGNVGKAGRERRLRSGEGAAYVAGIGAEIEDIRKVPVYVLFNLRRNLVGVEGTIVRVDVHRVYWLLHL